eukprot:GHVS01087006.1.p1 GENE.GHVS01087006.1~~GHVS01087006.1.p1  ORF type:complete len:468 (+),score=78.18 GHVS01087006.1:256-1659(+)
MGNSCGGGVGRPFEDNEAAGTTTTAATTTYSVTYPPATVDSLYCCTYSVASASHASSIGTNPLGCCCVAPVASHVSGACGNVGKYRTLAEALSTARQCRDENKLVQAVEAYQAALSLTTSFPSVPPRPTDMRSSPRPPPMTSGDIGRAVNIELVEGMVNYCVDGKRGSSSSSEDTSKNTTAYSSQAISRLASGEMTNSNTTPRSVPTENMSALQQAGGGGNDGLVNIPSSPFVVSPPTPSSVSTGHPETAAAICGEIAEIFLLQKKPGDSLWWYNQAIQFQPQSPQYIYRKGVVLQQQGKLTEAIHQFILALRLDPINKAALFNLGTCYLSCSGKRNGSNSKVLLDDERNIEKALKLFEKFLAIDGRDNLDVLALISQCYEQQNKHMEALAYLNRVVELDPINFAAKRHIEVLVKAMNEMKKNVPENTGYRRRSCFQRPPPSHLDSSSGLYQQVLLQDDGIEGDSYV